MIIAANCDVTVDGGQVSISRLVFSTHVELDINLKCIKKDERLSKEKDDNLEELRKSLNIGQVWWDEVLRDMFLTTTFKGVS